MLITSMLGAKTNLEKYGGGGRIRTFEAFATELQSVGFDRSPTPPRLLDIKSLYFKANS